MMEIYDQRDAICELETERQNPDNITKKTPVQYFYKGKTIFVTGGSGFLGILLIEKLLRSCSDLKKIIILLREKKGKSVCTRMKEIFDDEVFEKMKLQNPNYRKQIEIVSGNCNTPYLGLDDDTIHKLKSEVDIIFHSAATVRFDEHIRTAYEINVNGTKTLLELAKDMKNLKAFVYVSTFYGQSHLSFVEEKLYPGALTEDEMTMLLKSFDDESLAILTPKILNGRFNTYTMTKAIAEELVGRYKLQLPVAIFRPSIVTATFCEPLTCWANNLYGATGVFVGTGIGFLRTLYCNPKCKAEIIPADRVINGLVVVPMHIQKYSHNEKYSTVDPVYNFVADQGNVLNWYTLMDTMSKLAEERKLTTDNIIWINHLLLEKNRILWLIEYFLLHILPAPFFIMMEILTKQKPRIWLGYVKLFWYTQLYSFFMINSWQIINSNAVKLYTELSEEDKILFNCSPNIDWNFYAYNMMKGLGRYIMKFDWNNDEKAQTRRRILYIMDLALIRTVRGLIFVLVLNFVFKFVSHIFGS